MQQCSVEHTSYLPKQNDMKGVTDRQIHGQSDGGEVTTMCQPPYAGDTYDSIG